MASESLTREQYVYMAKLSEQAERYEEMVQFVEKLVIGTTPAGELTVEERNLLSVAYKNVIGSLRAAWRIVSSIEQKEEGRKNDEHVSLVRDYRSRVESELSDVCASILKLLDSHLVPSAVSSESKVFYLKMKGDYHRYLAEFKIGTEAEVAEDKEVKSEEEEEVWSWGAGTDGQLGTGKLQDEHLPQLLHSLSSAGPISLLACGGAHAIALTTSGKVLTWGRGTSGQLGHGDTINSLQPKTIRFLESFIISQVSAGWSHSGFVSDSGCLFTCGDGSFGQLGHDDYNSLCIPKLVSQLESKHVEQIACGMRHSIVLLKGQLGDQVYGFGSGKRGQLGVSNDRIKSISVPQVTLGFEDVEVVSISANGDHSAALSADGHLYTWGRGFSGNSDAYSPKCVPSSLRFTQVAIGWNHALLLTDDGQVFMLGGYHHGVLSDTRISTTLKLSESSREVVLKEVDGLNGLKVLQIAAGAEHSALVTENGVIQTWGWGEHGQLGLGDTCDQTSPQVVTLGLKQPHTYAIPRVYCGSGFTVAVRTLLPPFS